MANYGTRANIFTEDVMVIGYVIILMVTYHLNDSMPNEINMTLKANNMALGNDILITVSSGI
jgi:hypothetical protein